MSHPASRSPSLPAFAEHDILPDIMLPNQDGKLVILSNKQRGKMILLLICPAPHEAAGRRMLRAAAALMARLDPLVHFYAIALTDPAANAKLIEQESLPFELLSDLEHKVMQGLGVSLSRETATLVLADANRRVLRLERDTGDPEVLARLTETVETWPQPVPRPLGHFAPLLYLPSVLEPALCTALIEAHDEGATQESRVMFTKGRPG